MIANIIKNQSLPLRGFAHLAKTQIDNFILMWSISDTSSTNIKFRKGLLKYTTTS